MIFSIGSKYEPKELIKPKKAKNIDIPLFSLLNDSSSSAKPSPKHAPQRSDSPISKPSKTSLKSTRLENALEEFENFLKDFPSKSSNSRSSLMAESETFKRIFVETSATLVTYSSLLVSPKLKQNELLDAIVTANSKFRDLYLETDGSDLDMKSFTKNMKAVKQILTEIINDPTIKASNPNLSVQRPQMPNLFACDILSMSSPNRLYVCIEANRKSVNIFDLASNNITIKKDLTEPILALKVSHSDRIHLETKNSLKIFDTNLKPKVNLNKPALNCSLVGTGQDSFYLKGVQDNIVYVYSEPDYKQESDRELQGFVYKLQGGNKSGQISINQIENRNGIFYIRCQNGVSSTIHLWEKKSNTQLNKNSVITYNAKSNEAQVDTVDFKFSLDNKLVVKDWNEKVYKFFDLNGSFNRKIKMDPQAKLNATFTFSAQNEVIHINPGN